MVCCCKSITTSTLKSLSYESALKSSVSPDCITRDIMASQMLPGGWSGWTEADGEVKEICEKVKHEAEAKENAKFSVYTPLNYRRQTVAGANYEIKVYVGNDSCLFLKAFRGIGAKPEISIKSTAMLPMPRIITH